MNCETAKQRLNQPRDGKPSELGEAVDVLYQKHGSYGAIASQVHLSTGHLSDLRRVFLLPPGIRWQVDKGKIRIHHATQISRLNQEDDQWLLAFSIVDAGISVKNTKAAVNAVIKKGQRLQDVLQTMVGIRFDKVAGLLLPLTFEDRFKIIRAAWTKKLEWPDFSLRAIEEAARVDYEHIADELASIADQLRPRPVDRQVSPDSEPASAAPIETETLPE
jgi:hypothetical protein